MRPLPSALSYTPLAGLTLYTLRRQAPERRVSLNVS
jgi:hypothetical protein